MDIETIGLNIRKCRNAKKMRQEDLAQKANVSSNYISAVERGVKIPSVETLIDIMNALGVSADMIFCDVIDAGVTEKNNQLDAKVSQLSTKDRKTVYSQFQQVHTNQYHRPNNSDFLYLGFHHPQCQQYLPTYAVPKLFGCRRV